MDNYTSETRPLTNMSHRPANRGAVGPAPPKHSRLAAYPGGPRTATAGAPGGPPLPPVGVSASVGHDHWANDVLNVVAAGPASSQGSNSPGSSRSEPRSPSDHEDGGPGAGGLLGPHHSDSDLSVERRVLEKKRKFHTGRQLELKNLPDGCTEQVQTQLDYIKKLTFLLDRCCH